MDGYIDEKRPGGGAVTGHDSDSGSRDSDEMVLAAVGKKQVLRRRFNVFSILGIALSCTVTWEGIMILFLYGLIDGGPAGLVYGFLFCWAGYLAIIASLAELASIAPTAGGQYHWVYLFAPDNCKVFLSFLTGWQQVIAWQAITASGGYLCTTIIQGLVILNHPEYATQVKGWQGTLIIYAVIFTVFLFNSFLGRFLPQVEWAVLAIHLGAFVGILVPLVYFAPHGTADDVFATFLNGGGYSSNGVTFFVGIATSTFAFLGADAPIHLCEEIKGATTAVPWIMVSSILINGTLGFAMLIALLFCIGNIDNALDTDTGYPFIEIFNQAIGSVKSATAMASFITALLIFATISIFAATSRMTWAFARDRGLPGHSWISKVDKKSKLPIWSMVLTLTITLLLALIDIGSAVAFNAIVSLVIAGFLGSYLLPVGLLVWMKLTRPSEIRYGPWTLGRWGLPVNIFGLVWTTIATIFSFFPIIRTDLTAKTMNWSCVLFGGTLILAIIYYFAYGKRHYKGPVIETSVEEQLA